ncbi:uncharacterized protein SPSK_10625 [Sporothrix schenckii 1099-18]|uniref:Uncharacterized protein n=1 Tax=Sporothrix schenckii 1099-18 TaxID=1397361 RepID=A0A0F2LSV8_SPOSC|nr:uncharacterized protein SPSK_10625 [Sporothrix schenckii 1099-18]KJR80573.1 hypothetical protein SPSK_10625 [Sporothrix schenckii 1099-18]
MHDSFATPSAPFWRPALPQSRRASPPPSTLSPSRPRTKITEMIFCTSIRERPEWASVVPIFQAVPAEPRWETARLSSHDLAVRVASEGIGAGAHGSSDTIRFLLVAPGDVGQLESAKKLQRLAQRKNGPDSVVIFLLSRGDGEGHNMMAYKQLQLDLRDMDLSILPLTAVAALPATVAAFCSQLTIPSRFDQDNHNNTLQNLVRMYFGGPLPLSIEGAKRLIAATAASAKRPETTLQDVIRFCSDFRGRSPHQLADILGSEDASRLADF